MVQQVNTRAAAVLSLVLVLIGCGPSAKQVEVAKTARYKASTVTIFEIAEEVTTATFKIAEADVNQGALVTVGKWYSPDGQSESAGVGDSVKVEDGSLNVALLVTVAPSQDGILTVSVTPIVQRFRLGASQYEKVEPGDPSMPGWVTGKAEALLVAIHDRAKSYAVP